MPRERPILFSAPMVRAILDGSKTQTRRVAKEFDGLRDLDKILARFPNQNGCRYGQPGDRLWVRETWAEHPDYPGARRAIYRADSGSEHDADRWRPSIHMPRWACRIELEVTGVRVERLQAISEADARAEGARFHEGRGTGHTGWRHDDREVHGDARSAFARLWESINGAGSWDANPWVWVVEFRRVSP